MPMANVKIFFKYFVLNLQVMCYFPHYLKRLIWLHNPCYV